MLVHIPPVASSPQMVSLEGPFCQANWTNSSGYIVNRPLLGEASKQDRTHRAKRGAVLSRW
jgi:hypothetical protein